MPFHKTFGIDLGTSTVKIYSQEQDTMITEKNMIAIRNQNQVLAVGTKHMECTKRIHPMFL